MPDEQQCDVFEVSKTTTHISLSH